MAYINKNTKEYYYGGAMTKRLEDGSVWSGVPNDELLREWGYEAVVKPSGEPSGMVTEEEKAQRRMEEIEEELRGMDYLTAKFIDGEDMTKYGDWQEKGRYDERR